MILSSGQVMASSEPRTKFKFKNARKAPPPAQSAEAGGSSTEAATKDSGVQTPQAKNGIKDLDHKFVNHLAVTKLEAPDDIFASNNNDCILLLGHISGPCYLSNLHRCLVIVSCRQLRMHESTNCDVYLYCQSRPIVENCSGMRFAPFPEAYMRNEERTTENKFGEVQDFQWLGATQSPNWRILNEENRLRSCVIERLAGAAEADFAKMWVLTKSTSDGETVDSASV